MVSHKCCICGKQNKKNLRSLFSNCEIVGKNMGDFLCTNHKEQLGDFLDEIGFQDEFIRVRFDRRHSKFYLVPSSSPPLSSLCHHSSLKNPCASSTEPFACAKSLLSTFSRKLACTVCGEHRLEILPATFEIEPVSTVQLECRHCSYVFALSESTPDLQIISVPSSSSSSFSSSSTPASSQGASPAQDDDDVSDSSASSQGSVSSSPFAVEDDVENDDDDDDDAISPQQAASALLSLDRIPSPASTQEKTETQTKSFEYSKHVDFQMVSPRTASAIKRTQTSMSTSMRTSTSTSSMNGRISISSSTTTTTSSVSERPGTKRSRAEDQDMKLQEARAQAPKKRRLVESYTKLNPIKVQQSSHHTGDAAAPPRLPPVMQSFPMERLPTFEDLAVTLQTIVPYGLDHGQ